MLTLSHCDWGGGWAGAGWHLRLSGVGRGGPLLLGLALQVLLQVSRDISQAGVLACQVGALLGHLSRATLCVGGWWYRVCRLLLWLKWVVTGGHVGCWLLGTCLGGLLCHHALPWCRLLYELVLIIRHSVRWLGLLYEPLSFRGGACVLVYGVALGFVGVAIGAVIDSKSPV